MGFHQRIDSAHEVAMDTVKTGRIHHIIERIFGMLLQHFVECIAQLLGCTLRLAGAKNSHD